MAEDKPNRMMLETAISHFRRQILAQISATDIGGPTSGSPYDPYSMRGVFSKVIITLLQ
jgi:hypothetical protein